jgi:hypothetical protein
VQAGVVSMSWETETTQEMPRWELSRLQLLAALPTTPHPHLRTRTQAPHVRLQPVREQDDDAFVDEQRHHNIHVTEGWGARCLRIFITGFCTFVFLFVVIHVITTR